MIYTVTFNPTLDYIMYMDGLREGEADRPYRRMMRRARKA